MVRLVEIEKESELSVKETDQYRTDEIRREADSRFQRQGDAYRNQCFVIFNLKPVTGRGEKGWHGCEKG